MTVPRSLLTVVALLTALLMQLTVLSRLDLPGSSPDLVLLVVLALGMVWGPVEGAVIGFSGGLALDLAPPADHAVGVWAGLLCVAGCLAGSPRADVRRTVVVPLLIVVGSAIGVTVGFAVVTATLGDGRVRLTSLAHSVPAAVVYDVFLAIFVVPAVMALARRVDPERRVASGMTGVSR